ncbi:hypothetical protein EYF80_041003 [Liparis tanakae]|uniref:Uncharacterized protein n=1 Tax=Liparis tanakae TaxID=230148 RepID=A0A4Z2G7J4_9TELE|nr:hypothetical protein EYF80_041003 [Liparis tanakae]
MATKHKEMIFSSLIIFHGVCSSSMAGTSLQVSHGRLKEVEKSSAISASSAVKRDEDRQRRSEMAPTDSDVDSTLVPSGGDQRIHPNLKSSS